MFLTVWKYIFTIFALGYGVYTAYEDLKTKEIHATPVAINAAIGFILCDLDQKRELSNVVACVLSVTLLLMMFCDLCKFWGSGDTKMCFQGLVLSFWWLKPETIHACIVLVAGYMLISSIIGLITACVTKDKHPAMGHSFLITNVIVLGITILLRFL